MLDFYEVLKYVVRNASELQVDLETSSSPYSSSFEGWLGKNRNRWRKWRRLHLCWDDGWQEKIKSLPSSWIYRSARSLIGWAGLQGRRRLSQAGDPNCPDAWRLWVFLQVFSYARNSSTLYKNSHPSQENDFFFKKHLLAPSGALVVIMVYYVHTQRSSNPLFQIFQNLQILKWKWKWKDPTCAIFLKSMGFKDIEYDIPVYQM